MTEKKSHSVQAGDLQRRAEIMLQAKTDLAKKNTPVLSSEEAQRLIYDLQVHQIELEMQNEELCRAQAELEDSRARYFDLYVLAPVGYFTLNEKGLILEANLTAATMLGIARTALAGQLVTRYILPEDQGIYYQLRKQPFEAGSPQAGEMRMVKKDGTLLWVRLEATTVRDASGIVLNRVVLSDITSQKHAEKSLGESEALRQGESKFRAIFDSSNDGILIADPITQKYIDANASMCRMMGYTREEILNLGLNEFHPPADLPSVLAGFENAVATNAGRFDNVPMLRKDGSVFPADLSHTTVSLNGLTCAVGIFRDITERKRTEEKVRESEELLKVQFENSPDIILIIDRDFRIVTINRIVAGNLSIENIKGADAIAQLPLEFHEQARQLVGRCFSTGSIQEFEHPIGDNLWVRARIVPIMQSGAIERAMIISTDIAERKQMESELKLSEKRYQSIIEDQTELICRYLPDGRISFVNGAYAHYYGKQPKDLLGRNFIPHIPEPDIFTVLDRERGITQDTPLAEFEHRVIMPDNAVRWQKWTHRGIYAADGVLMEYQAVGHDITERKQIEEALRRSEEYFRSITEVSDVVIYRLSPAGELRYASPAALRQFGYRPEAVIGQHFLDFVMPADHPTASRVFQALRAGQAIKNLDIRMRRADGSMSIVTMFISPIMQNGELLEIQGVIIDISERAKAEEEVRRLSSEQAAILDNITCGILYLKNRMVQWANRKAAAMFGYSLEEIRGKETSIFYPDKESYEQLGREAYPLLAQGKPYSIERLMQKKGGELIWSRIVGQAVNVADLEQGSIWLLDDITERKRTEEELLHYRRKLEEMVSGRTQELQNTIAQLHYEIDARIKLTEELHRSKLFLTNILNSIQDGICVLDTDRKIMLLNSTLAKWVHVAEQVGFRTHSCGDLFHKLGRCDECVAESAMKTGGVRTMIFPGNGETDKKWFEIYSYPLNADDHKISGCVEYIRDVTAAKILEERITQHQEQLSALNYEMAALENREQRRIAQELHDSIPQTLAFCRMRLESIEQHFPSDALSSDQAAGFQEIYALLDNSIAEARTLIFKLAPPVLYELGFEPATQQLLHQFGKAHPIEFRFESVGRGAPIQGEGAAIMYGMVRELLTNCVKHSGASIVSLSVNRNDGDLIIEVRDNGRGVDHATAAYRAQVEGGGFGLFSIRERARHMDGDFIIESSEGAGACATIRVPLTRLRKTEKSQR